MTNPPSSAKRNAAQYLRMSKEQQRYSIANQHDLIAAYAAHLGFTIVKSYEDAGRSGVTARRRDGLKELLRDVVAGDINYATILVVDVSRWGRYQDHDEAAHYEFLCRRSGVQVLYCAETFENDNSATSAIVKSLKRVMAADYSRQLSDRCQAGLRRQVMAGFAQGGPAPYGARRQAFDPDGSAAAVLNNGERRVRVEQTVRWVCGPSEETRMIRRIFDLFLDGQMGITEIAALLNVEGHPYSRGGAWTFSRVKGVLTNEIAIGVFAFNKRAGHFPHKAVVASPEQWMRIRLFPPIISPERFRATALRLQERRGRPYSDAEMLSKLRALLDRRGTLSQTIMDQCPLTPGSRAFTKRFGSIEAAYRQIDFVSPKRRGVRLPRQAYERPEVSAALRRLYLEQGYLTAAMVDADVRLPTATFVAKLFGSLDDAYASAGFYQTQGERQRAGWERARLRRAA